MLAFFSNLWAAIGISKYYVYTGLAALVVASLVVAYLHVQATGAQKEKLKQLQDNLSARYKETQERAKIQATNSADARKRLLNRWSSN